MIDIVLSMPLISYQRPLTLCISFHLITYRVPLSFIFRHLHSDNGDLTRLYFLGMPQGYRENTLLYVDLPAEMKPESEVQEVLEWKPLLDSFHSMTTPGQFSKVCVQLWSRFKINN